MRKECKVNYLGYSGKGFLSIGNKKLKLEYDEEPNAFAGALTLVFISSLIYVFFTKDTPQSEYRQIAVGVAWVCAGIFFAIAAIPPAHRLFYKYKKLDLYLSAVDWKLESDTYKTTSNAKVATKIAASAMAGILRADGKRKGASIYSGISRNMSDKVVVTSNYLIITLDTAEVLLISADERIVSNAAERIRCVPKSYLNEYLLILQDIRRNRSGSGLAEVEEKLKTMGSEIEKLEHLSRNDTSIEKRNAALRKLDVAIERMATYQRILEIKNI